MSELGFDFGRPVVHETMASEITNRLREMILRGQLAAGSHLHQEELSEALGVSRTPLRQALTRLGQEGFVKRNRNNQFTVAAVDKDDLHELYLVRRELDGLAAALAASRHAPEDLEALEEELEAMEEADPHTWLEHHRSFHVRIYDAAMNEHLKRFQPIVELSTQLYYPQLMADESRRLKSRQEHRALCAAIAGGDPEVARAAARRHIDEAVALLK